MFLRKIYKNRVKEQVSLTIFALWLTPPLERANSRPISEKEVHEKGLGTNRRSQPAVLGMSPGKIYVTSRLFPVFESAEPTATWPPSTVDREKKCGRRTFRAGRGRWPSPAASCCPVLTRDRCRPLARCRPPRHQPMTHGPTPQALRRQSGQQRF